MRTVLVTGAGDGIGRATARRLARTGHGVVATDIDREALASLRAELGERVETALLDVRDADAWAAVLARVGERTGGALDVLVNNAGLLAAGRFSDIPLARQRDIVDVNVTGVITGCHLAHPYLRRSRSAHVVNIASAAAIYGQPELATYSATKFAVRGLTEALDLEWAADGIRVSAVWPLFVETAMTAGVDVGSTRSLGVSLTADDVAETVVRLLASRARRVGGVHHGVGRQARALMAANGISPSWLTRVVNRRITGSAPPGGPPTGHMSRPTGAGR